MKKTNGKPEVSPLASLLKQVGQAPHDDDAKKRWPTLWACLTPVWKDGKCTRQSGRLSIRLSGSWFVATLSCPTEGLQTSAGSESLVELFDKLETHLRNPACQWEPDWDAVKKTRRIRIDDVQSD